MYHHQEENTHPLCEPLALYSRQCTHTFQQLNLFPDSPIETNTDDIRVIELFAGVGGFRIGLERASKRFKTIWNNQWEPSTKRQDASIVYCQCFGVEGHSNCDIAMVPTSQIPDADLLVGGFPCQDYSVATTLKNSGGIEGKKGVLWWEIYRILKEKSHPPRYLLLENVDRLLSSPASQRGRDFAIILASLSDLGYCVEWRVINAAEYGMPQRRKRTYIVAYHHTIPLAQRITDVKQWLVETGVMSKAFPVDEKLSKWHQFNLEGSLQDISTSFNQHQRATPFRGTGIMVNRQVTCCETIPVFLGHSLSLGDILMDSCDVPQEFFIDTQVLPRWEYLKGGKSEKRVNKTTGFEYHYSEGKMIFPDSLNRPSRTIITGEGGASPSRFKHVILTPEGRYRRLTPIELERLNMFPDNHTQGVSDVRRAFLMGNALVTGIVERIGLSLLSAMTEQKQQ